MAQTETDIQRILIEELEALKRRISDNIGNAGQRASGRTQEGMSVEVHGTYGELTGRQAFSTLEKGSRPWEKKLSKTPKWFADIIQEWLEDKGLSGKLNAWVVAHKIRTMGSQLRREGGRADIYSPEIETAMENISSRVSDYFSVLVTDRLIINQDTTIEL